ncbi:hypothetical protein EUGRSUZ_C02556 [Eucalyptus grandis]|uniref:Uncharacterized protein n=2 Tax=Eucalyptus grandis TaxID=71139 RepID=A0ACC3LG47_EUCGR|nr:hypothetical protein EUGRSUZ_C02556 [Eucalyptus grandis]
MEDINIVIYDGVPGLAVHRVRLCLCVPAGEPEEPAPADDGHLPHTGEHRVPAEHAQRAPVVLPLSEHVVLHHEQPNVVLRRQRVDTLGPPDLLGAHLGAFGQWVIDHDHGPEPCGRRVGHLGLSDAHGGRVAPAHDVVEVEVEVAQLLLLEPELLGEEAAREGVRVCGDKNGRHTEEREGYELSHG